MLLVDFLAILGVEDGRHMGLDGDGALIVVALEGLQYLGNLSLTFTGHGVLLRFGLALFGVGAILDVDVGDVLLDRFVKLQSILPWERFGLGAIELEHGIAGVEDQLQIGHFLEKAQGMHGREAAVVHAVLVNCRDAGFIEAADDGA